MDWPGVLRQGVPLVGGELYNRTASVWSCGTPVQF